MKTDKYGEVLNAEETYREIASQLNRGSVIIGWTDEGGTHLDILFAKNCSGQGDLQRGLRRHTDLFVGIVGINTYGFTVNKEVIDWEYIATKMGTGFNSMSKKLAELINGVRWAINWQPTYRIVGSAIGGDQGIQCLLCSKVSYSMDDIKNKYCGSCHKFHEAGL